MRDTRSYLLTPILLLAVSVQAAGASQDLFKEKISPIIERHCLGCHNDSKPKGKLSMSSRDALLKGGRKGASIVPGDAGASLLLERVTAQDKKTRMPKNREPLSVVEIEDVRKWIKAGAPWPAGLELVERKAAAFDWWSFKPLERSPVPRLEGAEAGWIRNPVDAFVLARLLSKGLKPSAQADRLALIRRLSYDLLGLPPTPAEVDRFRADKSPRAYEELVERLLASKHYGERWARHWLDVVKYADTCGYDKDKLRANAWPYRDYVIRSFNDDKKYSRFVEEQLAGDVFFPGDPDGVLGLGFIAAGPWDFIGHVEVSEAKIDGRVARHIDRDEMVTNTINTFTSLTIQCARCHDHKFDPFTQRHYYGLQDVFAAVDRAERPYDRNPGIARERKELNAGLARARAALKKLEAEAAAAGGGELAGLNKAIGKYAAELKMEKKSPAFGYHSQISARQEEEKWVAVDLGSDVELSGVTLHPCHDEYNNIGAGFGFPVRFLVEAAADKAFSSPVVLADETGGDYPNPGLAAYSAAAKGVKARFVRVRAVKLAPRSNDYIFALGELEAFDKAGKNVARGVKVISKDSIQAPVRWARRNLTDGSWPRAKNETVAAALAEARKKRKELMARLRPPEWLAEQKRLQAAERELSKKLGQLKKAGMVYAAATHFAVQGNFKPTKGKPREIHVLQRGDILKPGEKVRSGILPFSPEDAIELELPEDHPEGARRAALARWITSKGNPLTWRSIVNRAWLWHFGAAIVDSPNDFGRMGQLPSHPGLLDWLACEFRDGDQSFKTLHRLIVTSSAYRQASTWNRESAVIDSGNRLLWRMNRRRLEAEELRDAMLMVSGKLKRSMYGPGFYLFKLEKTAHSPHYEYHKFDPEDPASHRRSIYRFIVRSQPDPFMTTFNCADSSQSTPKRDEALTALQALSLLNSRFSLVMAGHFARRLEAEADSAEGRVRLGVRLLMGREATKAETAELAAYAGEQGLPNLCRVLFNLSEFTYLD